MVSALFEVTAGDAILPPPPEAQTLPRLAADAPAGSGARLWADHRSGPVDSPIALRGAGFPANTTLRPTLTTVRGNRIAGAGWEVVERDLGTVETDMDGDFSHVLATPDDSEATTSCAPGARAWRRASPTRSPPAPGVRGAALSRGGPA